MKSLTSYITESRLSHKELRELADYVERIAKMDEKDFDKKMFEGRDEFCKRVEEILRPYDPYMEDVIWECRGDDAKWEPDRAADRIEDMAVRNEVRTGTEPIMVIHFLEELCNFLDV